ncbi:hypothetical protein N7456_000063 [Penicillium angulare]|uniref:Uncharacterized protein n=1 Tax=Penicillium angulare TaxID=116970 RepID=A0A9W9KRS6_9EURO|nr:hypothetical protein N7456_000063 [Penicillium angulare]
MVEKLEYKQGLRDAINGLAAALKVKGNILVDSEITTLTTLGVAYWDDTLATGITGCYNGTTWTVRWDWDPVKLSHINTQYGSQKTAYLEQSKADYLARQNLPEAERDSDRGFRMFTVTLKKVTEDAEWRKDIWDSRGRDLAYKRDAKFPFPLANIVSVNLESVWESKSPLIPAFATPHGSV